MKKIIYILLSIFLLAAGCNKDENDVIPFADVNLFLHTSDPLFINLNAVGGWIYLAGGSRGIIVYKVSNSEFRAYDRHCTFQPTNTCALVSVEVNNITGLDDCCGSKFILASDGFVSNGPATLPLKKYQTSFDGQVLRIFN
jgi:hypothetical protein